MCAKKKTNVRREVIQFSCRHASAVRRRQRDSERPTPMCREFGGSHRHVPRIVYGIVSVLCANILRARQAPSTQVCTRMRVVVISGSHYKEMPIFFAPVGTGAVLDGKGEVCGCAESICTRVLFHKLSTLTTCTNTHVGLAFRNCHT